MVRSAKKALYQTLSETSNTSRYLKEDELRALMAEVTRFLNSRPVTYESSDVNDLRALTPNHFLLQKTFSFGSSRRFLEPSPLQFRATRRWSCVRPFREGIPAKPNESKEVENQPNQPKPAGDVVLVADPNLPWALWRLVRVNSVFPGADGCMRAVEVRTG